MHGDTLCIDDHAYMKTRKRLRSVLFKWFFLRKPLTTRRKIAAEYRQRSGENKRMTAADIMDANSDEVVRVMNRYQVTQLIHGHTHRPNVHQHTLKNGTPGKRIVLDEWHGNTASLWVEHNGELKQESFS
jgi:UDP-2,3-diacylglucosamine hydrolase